MSDSPQKKPFVFVDSEVDGEEFSPATQQMVLGLLGKMKVKCCLCDEVTPISRVEEHEKTCDGVVVECAGKEAGCTFSNKRKDMTSHEGKCDYVRLLPMFNVLKNNISSLQTQVNQLQEENVNLRTLLETDPIDSQGMSYFNLPVDEPQGISLYCGQYKVLARFKKNDDHLAFYFMLEKGPFEDAVTLRDVEVELALLEPDLTQFKAKNMDSREDDELKELLRTRCRGRGFREFCELKDLERIADARRKVWFSITFRKEVSVTMQ